MRPTVAAGHLTVGPADNTTVIRCLDGIVGYGGVKPATGGVRHPRHHHPAMVAAARHEPRARLRGRPGHPAARLRPAPRRIPAGGHLFGCQLGGSGGLGSMAEPAAAPLLIWVVACRRGHEASQLAGMEGMASTSPCVVSATRSRGS